MRLEDRLRGHRLVEPSAELRERVLADEVQVVWRRRSRMWRRVAAAIVFFALVANFFIERHLDRVVGTRGWAVRPLFESAPELGLPPVAVYIQTPVDTQRMFAAWQTFSRRSS